MSDSIHSLLCGISPLGHTCHLTKFDTQRYELGFCSPPVQRAAVGADLEDGLADSASAADEVIWYQPPGLDWDLSPVVAASPVPAQVASDIAAVIARVVAEARDGDAVVVMSNGGFGGIHQKLLAALRERHGGAA